MAFIGVIVNSKYELQVKRVLESKLNSLNKEYTIILINKKSIENIKNIRFETVLVTDLEEVKEETYALNEIFKNLKYLIINADMEENLNLINNMKLNVITFGFSPKSTIIATSVEENFLICLQRKIIDINQKMVEPQEIQLKIQNKKLSKSSHNLMGIASILLIYGKI